MFMEKYGKLSQIMPITLSYLEYCGFLICIMKYRKSYSMLQMKYGNRTDMDISFLLFLIKHML